ncbi:gst2 Glutathione S-transferase 2 [Candida maltosa Xu316]|uniref:Putative glutathione S-transferase n=1 Tax=Candida maltosa (strain Xu316) TaxID=1245528 RepID=M3JAL3_CANMX|nr:putative glutathione S-transferase [Candida maltosa Xu316]
MQLYSALTGNGRKAIIYLHLLNIKYDLKLFPFPSPEMKEEWYLKLNPHGLIPTLVDGDLVLPESNAILQYLADTYDKENKYSYPHSDIRYWSQQRWLYYQSTQFCDALGKILLYKHIKLQDEFLVNRMFDQYDLVYKVFNDHLAENKWFVGDKFTIADLSIASGHYFLWSQIKGTDYELKDFANKFPHVLKWFDNVLQIEGFKEALEIK